ncbi:MAG TPA: DUF4157 domain-containing protein [Kofleriaceae bacterium]|nr:DUF4157 domain-containing protein [Kofleriaceae bacterium]
MDLPYRSEMEAGFGRSFSGVTAYGGGAAAEANTALNAQAYTVGQSVAFKDANPSKAVVAHELAHTVQQGDAGPVQTWAEGKDGDAYEQEADDAAATVLAGGVASPSMRTGPSLHKWGGSDHYTIGNLAGQKALQMFQAAFPGVDPMVPTFDMDKDAKSKDPNHKGETIGGGVMHGANADQHPDQGPMQPHDKGTAITGSNGDNTTLGVNTNGGHQISFGAASRAGGDYVTTVAGLADRKDELGGTKGAGGGNLVTDKTQFAQMAIGGTTNSNHFFPVNGAEYRGHHGNAMVHAANAAAAAKAGNNSGVVAEMSSAMQEEGFGNHFLQDTFSSGHMAPRSLDSTDHLLGHGPGTVAKAMSNVASGITAGTAAVTGAVGKGAGAVTGGIVGGIKGFGGAVGDWFSGKWSNPFTAAADGAVKTGGDWAEAAGGVTGTAGKVVAGIATSPLHAPAAVQEAPGFMNDAAQGLMRTKQWHDYFCALPEGLPTTRGRFHGDYLMDGNDLEVVSDTCANSIFNVLAAAHGRPGAKPVEIPRPDFGAIMSDQKIGPVWRLMMSDYEKDLQAAKDQVKPGDTHTTDGGVTVDSQWIINEIQNATFGGEKGMADAKAHTGEAGAALGVAETVAAASKAPLDTINNKRVGLRDSIDAVHHYASMNFGFNEHLLGGQGADDDMNRPENKDPEENGFDPVQIESTFGLYTSLARNANEFVVAAAAAGSAVGNPGLLGQEKEHAQEIAAKAAQWASEAKALVGMTDSLMYGKGHGTIGSGDDKKKRTALRKAVLAGVAKWNPFFGVAYQPAAEQHQDPHKKHG